MNGIGGLQFKASGLVLDMAHQPTLGTLELSGANLKDFSSHKNHGAMTNITTTVLASGLAVPTFNEISSVINCGSKESLNNLPAMTFMAWINPTTMGGASQGRLFDKSIPVFTLFATNTLCFQHTTSGTALIRTADNSAITLGTPQLVTLTWTGSLTATTVKIYINDTELTYQVSQDGTGTRNSDASNSMLIGNNAGGSRAFDNYIAFPRIRNYVLSAAAIGKIYTATRWWFGV